MIKERDDSPFWIDSETESGNPRLGLAEAWLEKLEEDVVGLELAQVETQLQAGDAFGFIVTPSRTLDLRAPAPMVIARINPDVEADARLIKTSPYHRGWLFEFLPCTGA